MGIAQFRKLDREHLRALNYELTDEHCIVYAQAQALQKYYATGKAPAAVLPLVKQLEAIAAASLRDATPGELGERQKQAHEAASHGGFTEQTILDKLKARAGELGSATSFANQLRARQELTDSLRDKLLREPASERVTEAQLKLLLYTDPQLIPRQNK